MRSLALSVLFSLIIIMSFSCQERTVVGESDIVGYSIDTVHIDSKGKILDLSGWMLSSDLDDSERFFYLFNYYDFTIDEINLERKEYIKSYPLEKEGPNGVGQVVFYIQSFSDSLFLTKSPTISSLVHKNGQSIERIDWENAKDVNGAKLEQFPIKIEAVTGKDKLKAFGLSFDFNNEEVFLDILSTVDSVIKRYDVDPENSFNDFFLKFENDGSFMDPAVNLSVDENYILISHEFSNEIIVFNHNGEQVKIARYEPKLTPKRASVPEGPKQKPREQIGNAYQKLLEQVRFENPVWDKIKKRYFRLSSKRIFTETYKSESSLVPIIQETKIFLSVLDAEFNLISEIEIVELNDERIKYFAKDGKLWVCQNFSDELGFLVFDLRNQ